MRSPINLTAAVVAVGLCLWIGGITLSAESNVYWRADLRQGISIIAYGQGSSPETALQDCYRLQAITRAMTAAETRKGTVAAVTTSAVRWCNNVRRYSTVTPDPVRTATLSWTPPTLYTNGDRLTDIRNYKILFGPSPTNLDRVLETQAGSTTALTITDMSPGTWYFAVRTVAGSGVESVNSNVVSKVLL